MNQIQKNCNQEAKLRSSFGSRHFGSDNISIAVVVGFELSAGLGVVLERFFFSSLGSAVDSHPSGLGSRAL